MKKIFFFISILVVSVIIAPAQPCNMSGIYKIGNTGSYSFISQAVSDLITNGVSGPVILELEASYVSTGETFPINFAGIPCLTATNNLTIRPEIGATGLIIKSFNASTVTIGFNQARYITIDGRPGGVGTVSELTITSAAANGAIMFNNDASFNTVKYVHVASSGAYVINFSHSNFIGVSNGNRNNLISHCFIGDYFGSPISKGVVSVGTPGKKNSNNRISNCIFRDYDGGIGINIGANSSEFVIDSNSFCNSNQIGNATAIIINDTTSSGFQIIGNYIGGDAPQCLGNPVIVNFNYLGMSVAVGNQAYSIIDGNTIANFKWNASLGYPQFSCIQIRAGKVKCGDVFGNTIGSLTQNENILSEAAFPLQPSLTGIHILCDSTYGRIDSLTINNNKIGGIKCMPYPNNYFETKLRGIYVQSQYTGHVTISNNQIGSPTLENSLESTEWQGEYSTRGIDVEVAADGLFPSTYPIANIISGNTIEHLNGQVIGININGGNQIVRNNTIKNILSFKPTTFTNIPVIVCIQSYNCSPGTLITENTMYNCRLKGLYGASVNGIFADYASGIEISKNNIHSFQSEAPSAAIKGIFIYPEFSFPEFGNYKVNNNMICLGVDTAGNVINQPNEIRGVDVPLDSSVITHNSVYLGSGIGDNESIALHLNGAENNTSRISNNILVNLRTVQTVNFYRHFCIKFGNNITSFNQLYCNYNLYQNGGSQNYLGGFNSIINPISANLALWQIHSGLDLNSYSGNPNFKNPLGNYITSDLHLNLPSIADAAGIIEPNILFDIDNELRSAFTPVDIGADAPNPSPVSVMENSIGASSIKVYPNPANEVITINIPKANSKTLLYIYNSTMQLINTLNFENGIENKISITDLINGIYFIDARCNNQSYNVKFVVNR
jgi:hypothetical protein